MGSAINIDGELGLGDLLSAIPLHNHSLRIERKNNSFVAYVPIIKKWYMKPPLCWLMPFSKERAVALDRLGQEVFEACNGTSTMETIIENFSGKHRLTFHEARLSVMEFLRLLTRRGCVALVGVSKGESA